MGNERIVGVTCHDSRDLAYDAAAAGADYVAFGAFYPPDTKETSHWAEAELLSIWQESMETPCVAIGESEIKFAVREELVEEVGEFRLQRPTPRIVIRGEHAIVDGNLNFLSVEAQPAIK